MAIIIALAVLIAIPAPLSRADSPTYTPAAFSCDNVTEIPKSECEALVALYNSTNGPNWTNKTNWLQTNTPCSWAAVECNAGHVAHLFDLSDNQLSGPIPPALGQLTQLEDLVLFDNRLTGPIPRELGQMTQLEQLVLDGNQLSGPIPPDLGNCKRLWSLILFDNELTGPIPPQLGELTLLYQLGLSGNQLSGAIPPELGQLTGLGLLYLSANQLSGVIPPELGSLSELQRLSLSGNQLTGPIPPELGQLNKLWSLSLSTNQLSGSVPPGLGDLANLRGLSLNSNQLSGPLPSNLTSLQLDWFRYQDTNLCAPGDAEFQTWLNAITDLDGTGVTCGAQTVSGFIWNDANRNGSQDAGESGLEGATVTLTQDTGAQSASIDAAGRRVFTDSEGRYRFDYVATGPHAITVTKPGYLPTSGATIPINVPAEGSVNVPPVGIAWAPVHVYLPLIRK